MRLTLTADDGTLLDAVPDITAEDWQKATTSAMDALALLELLEAGSGDVEDRDCVECGVEKAEHYGMCASCLHNAKRSGWEPGQ